MDEMIMFWLIQLYEEAIDKTKLSDIYDKEISEIHANIRNHKLWLLGAKDSEEEQMETENIARLYEYIDVLTELKENLENK